MKKRHKQKQLKKIAEKQVSNLREYGYKAELSKLNSKTIVVHAENKYELYTIFIDKLNSPYHTSRIKKNWR